MEHLIIPEGYEPALNLHDTQIAIKTVKDFFQDLLAKQLNLLRVSAPLFVDPASGLNDNLNGVERPVSFDIKEQSGFNAEVVHSLAKWKRMALKKYDFNVGKGLYTDMNAIRRDEELSNVHSVYVDQWDWCKIITRKDRNEGYLKETVKTIVNALCDTLDELKAKYPIIKTEISRDVKFITTQELEDMYPDKTAKERENIIAKEYKTVFIMQIGDLLKSGEKHDGRAPDYDDWALNGDIIIWNDVLESAFEISSMGIRVDKEALQRQLKEEKEQSELLGIIAEKVSEESCTEQCESCQKYCPASEECMATDENVRCIKCEYLCEACGICELKK